LDQITSDIKGVESSLSKLQSAGVRSAHALSPSLQQEESNVDGFAVASIADAINTTESHLGTKVTQLQVGVHADLSHLESKLRYDVTQLETKIGTNMSQLEANINSKIDARISDFEAKIDAKFDDLLRAISSTKAQ
jgi:hypothetical protein